METRHFSDETVWAIWQKGGTVVGYNPSKYRKDEAGAWISFTDYGNTNSIFGWEIDHIVPLSKGGTDNYDNLQPLQWENNRAKGDDFPTYNVAVTSLNDKNIHYANFR